MPVHDVRLAGRHCAFATREARRLRVAPLASVSVFWWFTRWRRLTCRASAQRHWAALRARRDVLAERAEFAAEVEKRRRRFGTARTIAEEDARGSGGSGVRRRALATA